MVDKSRFTPDEWKLLLESVMMAGIAVSAAEPSGLWGPTEGELRWWHSIGDGDNEYHGQLSHQSRRSRF